MDVMIRQLEWVSFFSLLVVNNTEGTDGRTDEQTKTIIISKFQTYIAVKVLLIGDSIK